MRIAFVGQPTDNIPPQQAGSIAVWAAGLSAKLARRHDVTVYCRKTPDRIGDDTHRAVRHARVAADFDDGVVETIRTAESRTLRLFGRRPDLFYRYYYYSRFYYRRYIRAIARRLEGDRPDLIVLPNFSQFVPELRRSNPDAKIALVMQCDWLIELDEETVSNRLDLVDAVIGCSDYISQGVAKRFPVHASKCHTVYNAADPELFVRDESTERAAEGLRKQLGLENKRVILFSGRLCPEKGVHVLLDAMKRVKARHPDTVLLIVGLFAGHPPNPAWLYRRDDAMRIYEDLRPEYLKRIEHAAEDLDGSVQFLRSVSHFDLPPYYTLAELFVHPSLWNEPFGMVLTEAMACELPVVSTRAGGIPEIVGDGETGFLAERGSAESLAEAILKVLGNEASGVEMGKEGRRRMTDRFTWDNTDQMFEAVLEKLFAGAT